MASAILSRQTFIRCALVLAATAALAGCFEGESGNSQPDAVAATETLEPLATENQPPEISGIPAASIESGQTYTFVPAALDADQDFLEFQVTNKPEWAQFSSESGELAGTPQDDDVGETAEITIAVTDGRDHRAIGPFRIRIGQRGRPPVPGNVAPVITGTPSTSAQVGNAYRFEPTASDANSDRLTFIISNRPSWMSFSTVTGVLTGTPAAANAGVYSNIVVSVTDGKLTTSLPRFTLQVNSAANRAPTISGSPSTSVQATQAYSFAPAAADADADALSYSIQNKPSWATFSATNGRLTGTPTVANVGNYANVVVSVSDGRASTSLPAFAIAVQAAANRTPVISGSPVTTATVGSAFSFRATATDPDGDALGYSIQNRPAWATFNTTTGTLAGTPTAAGTSGNIIVSVSDGRVSASLPAFAIVASAPANGAPTISGTPATSATVGGAYNFQPAANDPNGDALSWSITNKPSWATFSTTTGRLSGTASAGTFANIAIRVTDGSSTAALAAFTITVAQATNGSAGLSWQAPTQNTDGSTLGDLAGFRVVYGTSAGALSQTIQIADASATSYTVGSLTSGTWYFAVKAYTTSGAESVLSEVASKTIQ